jgi:hypothetical protein
VTEGVQTLVKCSCCPVSLIPFMPHNHHLAADGEEFGLIRRHVYPDIVAYVIYCYSLECSESPPQINIPMQPLRDILYSEIFVPVVKAMWGLWSCEILRIPHCLDSRLTDGGKVVSPTHRPRSTPPKQYFSTSNTHFCQRLSEPQGLLRPEG